MVMALLSVISNVSGVGSKNIGGRALGIKISAKIVLGDVFSHFCSRGGPQYWIGRSIHVTCRLADFASRLVSLPWAVIS